MIVGVDRVVQRIAEQCAEIMRETIGKDAFALDEAGITIGGFLAGTAAVEQHHGLAPPRQMDGRRQADNACAQNNDVCLHILFPVLLCAYFFSLFMICSRNPSISAETTKAM